MKNQYFKYYNIDGTKKHTPNQVNQLAFGHTGRIVTSFLGSGGHNTTKPKQNKARKRVIQKRSRVVRRAS